jgi:queuine tRNA-ribosyltransferase
MSLGANFKSSSFFVFFMFEANGRGFKTPMFMPVATKLSTKLVSLKEVEEMGYESVIANSFLLYLDPGLDLIEKMGGLREFTGTNLNFFTDSGGFQLLYDEFFVEINQKGVKFRSPYDKSLHMISPEESMRIQEKLGGDVVMCLDYMPRYSDKKEEIAKAVELTTNWARKCKENYKGSGKLFGIVQGGIYEDLRRESVESLKEIGFEGYAIGGLGIGESREEMKEVVRKTVRLLPKNKPIYLMGIGHPGEVKEFIGMGVSIFDSVYPTRVARHGRVFVKEGHLDLGKEKFKLDLEKIEEECECEACENFTRAYIHHLIKIKEPLAKRLMTLHNLEFMKKVAG